MSTSESWAAGHAQRVSEHHVWEKAQAALATQKERDLALANQRRAAAAAAPKFTRSIVPQTFHLPLSADDESALRADVAYQQSVQKYAEAWRRDWWPVIHGGDRIAIDRAAREMMGRVATCAVMALNIGIRAQKEALAEKDRDLRLLQADRDRFKEERDRAFDEAREARAIPAPIRVELTLPDALPDLNVNVKPSAGVEIVRDHAGNVTGTKPRRVPTVDKVAKALKGTSAGQSVAP